jgi:site-specific recombinase XerD
LSPSSRRVYHSGVKFFYQRTLLRPDLVSFLICPRIVHKLPRVLCPSELGRLLGAVRLQNDRALFALIYDTGLRVSEATGLKVGDLDPARGIIHVQGGKDRLVKLGGRLFETLRAYWREVRRKEAPGEAFSWDSLLFANRDGGPLSVRCAQRVQPLHSTPDLALVLAQFLCWQAPASSLPGSRRRGQAGQCSR